ncbi:MAG: sodium/solute symporter [Planctomycetales bacterium]|nr:sodium/solute symporter [Planctomycetales bacterium]
MTQRPSLPYAALSCLVAAMMLPASGRGEEGGWDELPPIPNALGVAGPVTGAYTLSDGSEVLLVGGGANFPQPVWETTKQWVDEIHVLVSPPGSSVTDLQWSSGGHLPRPLGYSACVSLPDGVLAIGGNDADAVYADVLLLQWDGQQVRVTEFPKLPSPNVYGQAVLLQNRVHLIGGQTEQGLESATTEHWVLDLADRGQGEPFRWRAGVPFPGPSRAFHMAAPQHNGYFDCLYVIGGRRQRDDGAPPPSSGVLVGAPDVEVLRDVWEFSTGSQQWRRRADCPAPMMAGVASALGQSHILLPGADQGELFGQADQLKDEHPGFSTQGFLYHTITDTWTDTWSESAQVPQTHVTTTAVRFRGDIVVPSGEVRPRVRTPQVLSYRASSKQRAFGWLNYVVLFGYLLAMVGVGLYFGKRNQSTDQFFRGGQSIPAWAAGCSIFATMLSSLTYTGVPSKAFAQDWVYALGNLMIPAVAVIAVYIAMPFFRQINATSAYEYLEHRFNRGVRVFGSLSFTVYHLFRMAVVMSLTGLALAVATPLTPAQSVMLMGVLSILYCTVGGIEAVIWTDTIQTFVLLGGAFVAVLLLVQGIDGGWSGLWESAVAADKLNVANLHWDPTSSQIALWVIVLGGFAQNISSYTADQAVVQRYMTTATSRQAAQSIWLNAVLVIPATILFFGIGTALFAFYRNHPEKLDPTMTTDQVFPQFIAWEMPAGLAGLLVAGVFAAAQSTVSTSMNSTATAVVTDFLRPVGAFRSERSYLRAARVATLLFGVVGTCLGLVFVNPEIRSLFEQFIKVIGLFMGVLGGLFVLGVLTRRANGPGALIGAFCGAAVMFGLWKFSRINGYLYTASGVSACFVTGYIASWMFPPPTDIQGLTIYDRKPLQED